MKRLFLSPTIVAIGFAEPIDLVNPSFEINHNIDGTALSHPEILGWEGEGILSEGDTDYGNGRWKTLFDDAGSAHQLTSHVIKTGESFSLRFDAALAPDTSFIPEGAIVGGALLNGNFDQDTSSFDYRIFTETPHWFNFSGDQNAQATTFSDTPGESRRALLSDAGNHLFALETGYLLTQKQKLEISYRWRDSTDWDDSTDQVRVTLFTTSDDTPTGRRTDIESMLSGPSTADHSYEVFQGTFSPIPSQADGKKLFVLLEGIDGNGQKNGFAEVDDFVLSLFNPLLIGPNLRNGDFSEDPSIADSRTFDQTPFWTNLNGNQNAQCTRTNILYNGIRTTVLNQLATPTVFANETGHTLAEDDVITVKFVWRDASNWNDGADRVAVFLYTTSNNEILGPRTILQTLLTPFSSQNNTFESFEANFDQIPASAVGKKLFVAFQADNGDGATGFGRVADFRLSVNDDDPALPPAPPTPKTAQMIAEAYIEENDAKQIIASRTFHLTQERTTHWQHFHLAIPPGLADSYAGKKIGIQFRTPSQGDGLLRFVDNIQLEVYPESPADGSFASDWNNSPNRIWPGPGYWGNRLRDWEVRNKRVNCSFQQKPRRVLHRIGTSIRGNGQDFSFSVRTGLASGTLGTGAKTGFLIGAGPNLDWRGALLVHDGLGRDFGTFLGINHHGAAIIDDLSQGGLNQISIGATPPTGFQTDQRLEFTAAYQPSLGTYLLTIKSFDSQDTLLSTASTNVSSDRILGSFGLLSNRSNLGAAFWFDDFEGTGAALQPEHDRNLSIIGALHTLHQGTLRISAHVPPVALSSTPPLILETWNGNSWVERKTASIDNTDNLSSYTATFEVPNWEQSADTPYRISILVDQNRYYWHGTIKKNPIDRNDLVVINTSCQRIADGNIEVDTMDWSPVKIWHPHLLAYAHIEKHQGDLLLALGDQIYEGQPTPENSDTDFNRQYDYLYKWYLWLLQVRHLSRDLPTISIPDDHDVFQGNLWGEGGISTSNQSTGGYEEPASWVRLVERTQTSHMPPGDPYHPIQPAPSIEQGIEVYFTSINYGGVGFAVLEDRKFKTGSQNYPSDPNQQFLLGERQKQFLRDWSKDWSGQQLKCIVSQTPFGMIHTHAATGYGFGINDRDSNGWPTHRREEAWELFRMTRSFQLAGDQHIGTLVHHGIQKPVDAGYSFTSPAISNFFPRVWDPEHQSAGRTEIISPYKGDFYLDGVGQLPTGSANLSSQLPGHIRVIGAANPLEYYNQTSNINPPNLHDRSAGYGVIRINKTTREITFECWPLHADPEYPQTGSQFPDWPVTIKQTDNDGRTPVGYLSPIDTLSEKNPVISVYQEQSGELLYSMRFLGHLVRLPVFDLSKTYRVEISYGDGGILETRNNLVASPEGAPLIHSFSAIQPSIVAGTETLLQWNVEGTATLTIDQGLGEVTDRTVHGIGHILVAPTQDTTYTLTLNESMKAEATVLVFQTKPQWLKSHFTSQQLENLSVSGDEADPDDDGFTNDQEYQFQTDPLDHQSLPKLTSKVVKNDEFITLDFTSSFPLGSKLCTLRIETSDDLESWSPLAADSYREISRLSPQTGETTQITIRLTEAIPRQEHQYYRATWGP